jgi:hypothetical protein
MVWTLAESSLGERQWKKIHDLVIHLTNHLILMEN